MDENDYTFMLSAGAKFRYNAGAYDRTMNTPHFEMEVSVPSHARNQIQTKQFLMGTEGNYIWVWDVENNSTWPAFLIVRKNGVLVKMT